MQLQQLICFLAVHDERHFTRAAAALHVAQPSLSKQIHNLERELGGRLFDRGSGGVTVTAVGEALLPYARRILSDVENARLDVDELLGVRAGRVRVGALPSLCSTVLAESLKHFHAQHPGIRLIVEEAGSRELIGHLAAGQLDLAIIVLQQERDDPDLVTQPLLTEELVVAAAVDDERVTTASLQVGDLEGLPMVMFREGYDLRTATVAACQAAGFEPTFAVEGGDLDAVLSFVEAGLGVAVVSPLALRGRPRIRQVTLTPRLRRTIVLARLEDVQPSHAALSFSHLVMRAAAELAPLRRRSTP